MGGEDRTGREIFSSVKGFVGKLADSTPVVSQIKGAANTATHLSQTLGRALLGRVSNFEEVFKQSEKGVDELFLNRSYAKAIKRSLSDYLSEVDYYPGVYANQKKHIKGYIKTSVEELENYLNAMKVFEQIPKGDNIWRKFKDAKNKMSVALQKLEICAEKHRKKDASEIYTATEALALRPVGKAGGENVFLQAPDETFEKAKYLMGDFIDDFKEVLEFTRSKLNDFIVLEGKGSGDEWIPIDINHKELGIKKIRRQKSWFDLFKGKKDSGSLQGRNVKTEHADKLTKRKEKQSEALLSDVENAAIKSQAKLNVIAGQAEKIMNAINADFQSLEKKLSNFNSSVDETIKAAHDSGIKSVYDLTKACYGEASKLNENIQKILTEVSALIGEKQFAAALEKAEERTKNRKQQLVAEALQNLKLGEKKYQTQSKAMHNLFAQVDIQLAAARKKAFAAKNKLESVYKQIEKINNKVGAEFGKLEKSWKDSEIGGNQTLFNTKTYGEKQVAGVAPTSSADSPVGVLKAAREELGKQHVDAIEALVKKAKDYNGIVDGFWNEKKYTKYIENVNDSVASGSTVDGVASKKEDTQMSYYLRLAEKYEKDFQKKKKEVLRLAKLAVKARDKVEKE